jgi:hypothetical protein
LVAETGKGKTQFDFCFENHLLPFLSILSYTLVDLQMSALEGHAEFVAAAYSGALEEGCLVDYNPYTATVADVDIAVFVVVQPFGSLDSVVVVAPLAGTFDGLKFGESADTFDAAFVETDAASFAHVVALDHAVVVALNVHVGSLAAAVAEFLASFAAHTEISHYSAAKPNEPPELEPT